MRSRIFLALVALALLSSTSARQRIATPAPTFSREIIRILQNHCQGCHRPNGMAPFPLMNYSDATSRAYRIAFMTATGQMPPWKPAEGCAEFSEQRRLSDGEIRTIAMWVRAEMPEGDRRDLPPPRRFTDEWKLGAPDLLTAMPELYVPPGDRDSFRCFVLPTLAGDELLISAIDFRPLARENVHHVIAYVDSGGAAEQQDASDPGPGYECMGGPRFVPSALLGAWFPGSEPVVLPKNVAGRLGAGARIVLQVHYHPHDGVVAPDRTEVALYQASGETKSLQFLAAENQNFVIPAGAADYQLAASTQIPRAIDVHAIGAHMHLLGRTMSVDAILPDGSRQCLLRIDDWDPAWQGMYSYRAPARLPAGTRITAVASYDNSSANPRNQHNPPRDVPWGEEAFNEMLSAYLAYTFAD